jgi:5-(aminomethyl)-3-furanmethanol phosphate kinase
MWVVKLGGSLTGDPLLAQWLALLAQLGGGRVTVVCGGGRFADEVRHAQALWQFDDTAAHNMAVLAMAQTAYMAQSLNPQLQLASSEAEIRRVLHGGHTAVWLPMEWIRAQADALANWDLTADSMAVHLARQLNAERLVMVKSCAIDSAATLAQLSQQGVLDQRFASIAAGAAFPISIVHKSALDSVRSLLIGNASPPPDAA